MLNRADTRLRLFVVLTLCLTVIAHADCYLTILHLNDFHGYLQPVEQEGRSIGGIARIATAVRQVREWNDAHGVGTLFVEAGDILQGTPLSMIYRGEPDFRCFNLMKLDMMCVGNHEFDFGRANFHYLADLARFPILSANIYVEATGERLVPPYVLFELPDGTRAAAFGLTSKDTAVETMPENVAGLRFADPYEECRSLLPELRAKADFLMAVTHIGYDEDLVLAGQQPDIDVIIGAHSHTAVQPPTVVGKTLVCQADSYGKYLGQVDMLVSGGDVVKHRGFLRPIDDRIPADPEVQAIVDDYADRLSARLSEEIALATVPLDGERDNVRSGETNLGNLVCDLYREYTQADVCVVNAGGIRAPIDAGPITVGDVLKVAPFSNLVARKRVGGEQLWQALARSASLERPAGGFLQVSGLRIAIEGQTLKSVEVDGRPLDREGSYILAAPQFLLEGGDGYEVLKEGPEPEYLGYADNAILIEMLRRRGTVSPQVDGRIRIE